MAFVEKEVENEERVKLASGFRQQGTPPISPPATCVETAAALVSTTKVSDQALSAMCVLCGKGKHSAEVCYTAKKMTLEEKRQSIFNANVCLRCLRGGHRARQCRARVSCKNCGKGHMTVMCDQGRTKRDEEAKTEKEKRLLANLGFSDPEVILQTIGARALGPNGNRVVRIFFDGGCQRSYCTNRLAHDLGLFKVGTKAYVAHQLFGGLVGPTEGLERYHCRIEHLQGRAHVEIELLGMDTLCSDIPRLNPRECASLFTGSIPVNDVGDACPQIDIVIGAKDMARCVTDNLRHHGPDILVWETLFGWIAMGPIPRPRQTVASLCMPSCADFWSLEALGIQGQDELEKKTQDQSEAWMHFERTLTRKDGRFQVSLPLKADRALPGNNRFQAGQRAKKVREKLVQSQQIKVYDSVFKQWHDDGIIERVSEAQEPERVYYLPHRPVFKENPNATTKCRPVFDGGAKGPRGSLNDVLRTGPNLIEKIPSILTRFRMGKIGVSSDIRAAFLMISVSPEDRDLLRFLWYDDEGNEVMYRHCRVVFGLTSSPFHLQACLSHLLTMEETYRDTANKLKDSFYCGNCVTSVDSLSEYKKFKEEAICILDSAKFDLRGWIVSRVIENGDSEVEPVLGLIWNRRTDMLSVQVPDVTEAKEATKRVLWSLVQRVFDPIGATAPVQVQGRIMLKEACNAGLDWDEKLPPEIARKLGKWLKGFPLLRLMQIPRHFGAQIDENATLHIFCDASQYAFAACCFLRLVGDRKVYVQLVSAKTRLIPNRATSIPRAELMGALLAARLAGSVMSALGRQIPCYFWSDSMVVLYWIKTPGPWTVFVDNRRKEILQCSKAEDWRHVPSQMNPADVPSGGCDGQALIEGQWWQGPQWLMESAQSWPKCAIEFQDDVAKERKKEKVVENAAFVGTAETEVISDIFRPSGSYRRTVRIVAYMMRWMARVISRKKYAEVTLESAELLEAEKIVLKKLQRSSELKPGNLNVFLDEDGLLRVKSKLGNNFEDGFRFPILLSAKNDVVKAMVREKHVAMCHANVRNLLSCLRKDFFILKARQMVRTLIHGCVRCRRYQAKPAQVPFCSLPTERTHMGACFEVTGVDHFGPLYTTDKNKVWVVIYTCAVYRAVHLEVVESLSTEAFLQSFRRFCARRGKPEKVYSDSGTAFVGADNLLDEAVIQFGVERGIEFIRGPPASPWWTGFIERMVGVIKNVMKRCIANAKLSVVELATLLCDVEEVCNNRPLTYAGEDEPIPLTPNDFLIPGAKSAIPELDAADKLRARSRYIQGVRATMRQRFQDEYLAALVQLGSRKPREIKPGDVVLVASDDKKRIHWPMGLLLETYPGRDGVSRVARLRVKGGELCRAFQRLYPLEVRSIEQREFRETPTPEASNENEENESEVPDSTPVVSKPTAVVRSRVGRVVKEPVRLDL